MSDSNPTTGTIPIVPVRPVRSWLYQRWMGIPEPRSVSLIVGLGYLALLVTGVLTLLLPPQSFQGYFGTVSIQLVGIFFILGSIMGMIGGSRGDWKLERGAIITMAMGVAFYAYIVTSLQITSDSGNRYTQMGMIVLAFLFLANRFARIWRYEFKPRG